MGDIVPINKLTTPKQVVESLSEDELDSATDIVVLRLDKEGSVLVSYNRMTPERMYYLAGVLERYALSL